MSPEKEQTLYEKYPRLFERHSLPASETCMCWGITTGDGWYDLIDRTCQKIIDYCEANSIEVPQLEQMKEKFGGLRIYFHNCNIKELYEIVSQAENESFKTCEVTGREGHLYNCNGYYRVLADDIAIEKNCEKCNEN